MTINLITDGPYVHALGWLMRPDFCAISATSEAWECLSANIYFDTDGSYTVNQYFSIEELLQPLSLALMRSSGIARPRSAAKSTIFAALLGKKLLSDLSISINGYQGENVGVAIASSSAITSIAWAFENTGVREGWDKTDTMLLPSSIPSAICTQSSAVFDTHATAISFQDGAFGMCAAFEYAHLAFLHNRADYIVVMGAEEVCEVQCRALNEFDHQRHLIDGAAGVVLAKNPISSSDWQLSFCENILNNSNIDVPRKWNDAYICKLDFKNRFTVFSSLLIPHALHQAFQSKKNHVLIHCLVKGRGQYLLGFNRNCTLV